MAQRFQEVAAFAGELFKRNIFCFVPIAQSHPINTYSTHGKTSWAEWRDFDLEMLRRCDELWVHCQDGWDESIGVKAEIRAAKHMKKPIFYLQGINHLEQLLNGELYDDLD